MKNIITISREFGSGGRYIGEEIARRAGMEFYDKEIIAKVAEETGFSPRFVEEKGEYSPTKSILSYAFVGRNATGQSLEDYMYSVQRKIIIEAAEKGPCVIVGRCADHILREWDDGLHVFISGNWSQKVKRIMELYHLSEAEAQKRMKSTDKKRSIHYKYYTDEEWGYAGNYTLCLNSSELGYEKCIQMILELAGR